MEIEKLYHRPIKRPLITSLRIIVAFAMPFSSAAWRLLFPAMRFAGSASCLFRRRRFLRSVSVRPVSSSSVRSSASEECMDDISMSVDWSDSDANFPSSCVRGGAPDVEFAKATLPLRLRVCDLWLSISSGSCEVVVV